MQSRLGFTLTAESMSGGPVILLGATGTEEVGVGPGVESDPGTGEEKRGVVTCSLIHGVMIPQETSPSKSQ